jgi:hypothetical protein
MQGTAACHHPVTNPACHRRSISLSLRPRVARLLTGAMRTCRRATFRLPAFCTRVSACPRGCFVGGMMSTPARVNA